MLEADPEYANDILVVIVPQAFTNFLLSGSSQPSLVHNPYFLTLIMFVSELSFDKKDLHHV